MALRNRQDGKVEIFVGTEKVDGISKNIIEFDELALKSDIPTEYIPPVIVSSQITARDVDNNPTEIKDVDLVRLYAEGPNTFVKLTGPHAIGKEYYIKNTTDYSIGLIGKVENINGNGQLRIPAKSYWHLIKEDSGTNSITAFNITDETKAGLITKLGIPTAVDDAAAAALDPAVAVGGLYYTGTVFQVRLA